MPMTEPMDRFLRARQQLWSLMEFPFDRDDIAVAVEGRRIIVTGERIEIR